MVTQLHTHLCLVQGVARPESGMNVYGPASPFILQDLAQGTMCTQGFTCVRHEVMCTQQRLTFTTEVGIVQVTTTQVRTC